jgi:parallel beta-helix repeat protein
LIYKYINIAKNTGEKIAKRAILVPRRGIIPLWQFTTLYLYIIIKRNKHGRKIRDGTGLVMVYKKRSIVFVMNIILVCLAGNLFLIEESQATGTTIYVDDSNTAGPWNGTENYPYKTIHDGMTAATDGDKIFVFSGTYHEKVDFTKDVTLTGENKDSTFVDGGSTGHVIYAHGLPEDKIQVSIKNLTIRNALGGGFDCIAFSYVMTSEISNNKILNSQEGEGISIDHCQGLTIRANTIMNNKIAGISVTASEQNTIENNIIQSNQKGIHLASFSANNQLTSNSIRDNTMYGVYIVQSSSNSFSGNDFTDNSQNAQDTSTNMWSINNQGNFWDDYNHYDNNSDGIGDAPYSIPGGSNVDNYPLGYFKQPEQPGGGNQLPVVAFLSISPNPAVHNESVSFYGEGTDNDGNIVGYHWRSSLDGSLSNEQTFHTSLLSAGIHVIYLKVMDDQGAWSTEKTATLTINSVVNQAPIASIDEITPNPAQQGEPVIFRGHGSDEDGVITAYKWLSSRDGVIGTTSSFLRSNLSRGTHTIYFQVKDDIEWSTQVVATVTIEWNASSGNPENQAPHAYAGGPYLGEVNEAINFNGSLSYDEEGTVLGFWNFGDSTTGNGLTATHIYTAPGTYTVVLTVTDEDNVISTATTSVIITQSGSQGNALEGFTILDFEIPFPVLMILVVLLIVGILLGFIYKIRQR